MLSTSEPFATALVLTTFGVLLGVSILFSRASERFSIPVALIFLVIGMLAGSQGIGGIPFEDYPFAFRLGTIALVLILFDGGLNTSLDTVRSVIRPAGLLATIGVVGTTASVAGAGVLLGFSWPAAMLLGAVVSSTDAAAVFAVLRNSGVSLKRRIGATLEVESGINDPMAMILTVALTEHLIGKPHSFGWMLIWYTIRQIIVGGVFGVALGYGGRALLRRLRLPAGGLYPVLTLALAFIAFGITTLADGSGFLAVYVTALIIGNAALPYRAGLARVHDALAWLSQVTMFLVLGLLVFPSRLLGVWWTGLALALFLTLVARPLIVALCLLPFRYKRTEIAYVGWVGLRGAVPIVLAIFPVLAHAPGAKHIFDVVFFIVVVNALIPGGSVPWLARRLRLDSRTPPPPRAVLEIESMQPLTGTLGAFYIDEALAVAGVPIAELPFPERSAVTLIVRGTTLIAPKGDTCLLPGDHAYVVSREEDLPFIQLMFGQPADD